MKFCEKLLSLRKSNNLSQEQLADKLGVSRQAVSKWESGATVPDMEKMMQLCKILNCNLEDLVDDGVGSRKQLEGRMSWRDYYQEFLDFITKTLNMFWSMKLTEKVKCILEMFFIGLVLFLLWTAIGGVVYSIFEPLLSIMPYMFKRIVVPLCTFVYTLFGVGASVVLLIHIFKIRYLDYFITIEDSEAKEKTIEIPVEELEQEKSEHEERRFIEKKRNKIVIRDPEHSTYGFFHFLAKVVVWFIKFMFGIFAIPCVISFVMLAFLEISSLFYLQNGVFFLGITLVLLGCIFINYLILKVIYYFVFEMKQQFKRVFVIFILALFLMGTGASISFCNYLNYEKVSIDDQLKMKKTVEFLSLEEVQTNTTLSFLKDENVELIEDNHIENIRIEIEHPEILEVHLYSHFNYLYSETSEDNFTNNQAVKIRCYCLDYYLDGDVIDAWNAFVKLIKEKKRIEIDPSYNYHVKVYASSENLANLKENYQRYYGVSY